MTLFLHLPVTSAHIVRNYKFNWDLDGTIRSQASAYGKCLVFCDSLGAWLKISLFFEIQLETLFLSWEKY